MHAWVSGGVLWCIREGVSSETRTHTQNGGNRLYRNGAMARAVTTFAVVYSCVAPAVPHAQACMWCETDQWRWSGGWGWGWGSVDVWQDGDATRVHTRTQGAGPSPSAIQSTRSCSRNVVLCLGLCSVTAKDSHSLFQKKPEKMVGPVKFWVLHKSPQRLCSQPNVIYAYWISRT